jgi:glutathione S-transferase
MKLYSGPLSLFSRKVEIALHEKGLAFERVMVRFTQTEGYHPKHPDVLAANPKGQVPVLVDGDVVLYDSTVILEYLEDAYPDPALYPRNAAERARCRLDELSADEVMLVPLRALMHRTAPRPSDPERWAADEAKAASAKPVLKDQLRALDRRLRGRSYLCGEFSVADIATFMTVFFCQRLGGPAFEDTPALSDWYERLLERPAFARTVSEMLAADLELSQPVEGAFGGRQAPRSVVTSA